MRAVTGASGAGKTAVRPLLVDRLGGEAMVFDLDWLIVPFARRGRLDDEGWAALRDGWLHVAHAVAQHGLPTVLLGPLRPEHLDELHGRPWVGDVRWLLLDCPDDERRRRLAARPRWRSSAIDEQVEWGRWLRANVAEQADTSTTTPEATADAVAAWVAGASG